MRRKALVAAPIALLVSFAACSLVENVDDYANGPTDSGVEAAPKDTTPADTEPADTAPADTTSADTTSDTTADTAPADTTADTTPADTTGDATADTTPADSGADSAPLDGGTDTGFDVGVDAAAPYRHTITIDGTNDFSAATEKLATTSTSYDAYVTWDASALYVAYAGPDLGASAGATKWVLVYLDVDPGAGTGANKTDVYTTQQHVLPTGFGAEAYFAVKSDGSFSQFKKYAGAAWSTFATSGVTFNRNAGSSFLELRIPFTALGASAPAKLGVVTFMLNEASGAEGTYAGLFGTSFVDGYSGTAAPKTILSYLQADFASALSPNAAGNKKP